MGYPMRKAVAYVRIWREESVFRKALSLLAVPAVGSVLKLSLRCESGSLCIAMSI